ncbi:MAG: hypothetical protein CSA35_06120 [Dethiosulfovibrio peptidovorans]|nr:MAG: hypothetical protein CSA35_06120 [Dethiosulfovibrio peptidovorans]
MVKVTMADVAREAKVNKATVSRALKGDPRISPVTREKVWSAAKRLGYRVDALARGLSSRRTDVIGVLIQDLTCSWVGPFFAGVERVLSRHRLEMMIKEADGVDASTLSAFQRLLDRKVDGVIWFSQDRIPDVDIPMVAVGAAYGKPQMRVLLEEENAQRLGGLFESPIASWVALELGRLSARGMVNIIKKRGVRPREVRVSPELTMSCPGDGPSPWKESE